MAWNEPGGGNKDPWSGKGGGEEGPPDLDEVVRKLQERLGGLFGGKKPPGSGSGGGGFGGGGQLSTKVVGVIVGILLVIWMATGIYIVEPAERGVVMRFGRYVDTTGPGPHWHLPMPIERVIKVNVDEISTVTHKAAMLTQDENIVEVELTVQSRIQDAADYLFQDQDPERTLNDATVTVVRVVIGQSKLDFVMTEGRGAVAVTIKERIQKLLDRYKTGLLATSVNMQPAKPPEQVKAAFDDAIKAREDKERLENQAEAYANEVLPNARGKAARITADAKAYRDQVIAESEGEASRFTAILGEYTKAPEVTGQRLYLETMEDVLSKNGKVILDVQEGGNSLLYLPIDQLMKQHKETQSESMRSPSTPSTTMVTPPDQSPARRAVDRQRGSR
ncbi:FtsH protease activity modulator HflK [Thiorhodococcus mannitoliphagus]|uniref:Protein HflK n=1 Tax=Thiorhodococcus mannitoliphagus TaxID=329406 RepID=A0A6P1DXK9_9GAMM|nr:FtsH protease activity modulator HflK [Thiorhodococcus mannitoliphagus]NEX20862.1 FtsH protease activity modulator HflK [Thiorhodococcus mannitoliphagus]